MVGLDTTRTDARASPLDSAAEEVVEGDEDVVLFFIAHGKLLFRYPVHNPFTADVGQRTSSTTSSTAAVPSTGSSGGKVVSASTTGASQSTSNTTPTTSVSGAAVRAAPLPRPSSKRTSSTATTRPSPTSADGDTPPIAAKARTSQAPARSADKPPLGQRDTPASPRGSEGADSETAAAAPDTTTTADAADESVDPSTLSRRARRRLKALKKAASAASTDGNGTGSEQVATQDDPSSPPRTTSTTRASRRALKAASAASGAVSAVASGSSAALDQLGGGTASAASSATTTVGVLAKRKRTAHVQDTAPSTSSGGGGATKDTSAPPAATIGVAPQRGLRRPVSFANLVSAEKNAQMSGAEAGGATATGAPGVAESVGSTASVPAAPSSAEPRRSSSGGGGARSLPDNNSTQQQQQQQQETCIGIQTNALLHLLRASLAGCTTIHVANVTFLVYPLTTKPRATDAEADKAEKTAGADAPAGRLAQARLLLSSGTDGEDAAVTAATLVVAMRRPDTDDGALARFVQCFTNCLCREEERVGYVGEQVRLMQRIAALWESGGMEAVMSSLLTGSHGDAATTSASSEGVAPTATDTATASAEDDPEEAYYAYLTDPSTLLGTAARQAAAGKSASAPHAASSSSSGWDGTRSLVALRAKPPRSVFSLLAAEESPVRLCHELTQLVKCANFWSRLWTAEAAAGGWGASASRGAAALASRRLRTGVRHSRHVTHTAQARWLARCGAVLKRPVLPSASLASAVFTHAQPSSLSWAGRSGGASSQQPPSRWASPHPGASPTMPSGAGMPTSVSPASFVSGVGVNGLLFLPASLLIAGHAGLAPSSYSDNLLASPYARLSPCGLITVYNKDVLATPAMQRAYAEAVGFRLAELLPLSTVAQCLHELMLPPQVGAFYRSLEAALLRAVTGHREAASAGGGARRPGAGAAGSLLSAAAGRSSPAPLLGSAVGVDGRGFPTRTTGTNGSASSSLRGRHGATVGGGSGGGGGASSTAAAVVSDVAGFDFLAVEVMELLKAHAVVGVEGELFVAFSHGDLAGVAQVEEGIRHRERHLKKRLSRVAEAVDAAASRGTAGSNSLAGGLADSESMGTSTANPGGHGQTRSKHRSVRWVPSSLTMMLLDQSLHLSEAADACESAEDAWRLATAGIDVDRITADDGQAGGATRTRSSPSPSPLCVVHCVWGPACPLCEALASTPAAWFIRPSAELVTSHAAALARPPVALSGAGPNDSPTTTTTTTAVVGGVNYATSFLALRFPMLDRAVREACQRRATHWWSTTQRKAAASAASTADGGGGSERGTPSFSPSSTPHYGFSSGRASGHASPLTPHHISSASFTTFAASSFQSTVRPWFLKPEMYMAPSTQHAISAVQLYKERRSSAAVPSSPTRGGTASGEDSTEPPTTPGPLTDAAGSHSPSTRRPRRRQGEGHSSKGELAEADDDDSRVLLTAEAIVRGAAEWLRQLGPVAQARLEATRQRRLKLSRVACATAPGVSVTTSPSFGVTPQGGGVPPPSPSSSSRRADVVGSAPTPASASITVKASTVGPGAATPSQSPPLSSPFMRYSKRVLPERTPPSSVFASHEHPRLFVPSQLPPQAAVATGKALASPPSPALTLPEPGHTSPVVGSQSSWPRHGHRARGGTTATAAAPPRPAPAALAVTYPGRVLPVEVLLQVVFHHLVVITWGATEGIELEALVRQVERCLRRLPPLLLSLRHAQQLQMEFGSSERLAKLVEEANAAEPTTTSTADTANDRGARGEARSLGPHTVASAFSDASRNSASIHYLHTCASLQLLRVYEIFDALQLIPVLQPYAGCHVQVVPTRLLLHAVVNEFSDVLVLRASSPSTESAYATAPRKMTTASREALEAAAA